MPNAKSNSPELSPFEWLNSRYVLDRVAQQLHTDKNRSLWRRLESELKRAGVSGVDTYLRSVFAEITQEVEKTLAAFREAAAKRN